MVCAGLPERVSTKHAVISNQGIHDRVLECMAHVQRAGDIGRRDDDAIRFTASAGSEIAVFLPALVLAPFDILRAVRLIHEAQSLKGEVITAASAGRTGQPEWPEDLLVQILCVSNVCP